MTSFYTITRGGVCSLYIRVRRDRNDVKYSTGIKVDADKWRRHKEKASTMMLADRLKKGIDAYMLDNPEASALGIHFPQIGNIAPIDGNRSIIDSIDLE